MLPARAPLTDEVHEYGGLFFELIARPEWLRRRVLTARFVDEFEQERRMTLDLDLADVARRAGGQSTWRRVLRQRDLPFPVPVLALKKELLLDVDVTDSDGRSIPIVTKDQNSFLSSALLLETASRHGFDLDASTGAFRQQVYDIVNSDSITALLRVLGGIDPAFLAGEDPSIDPLPIGEREKVQWRSFLAHAEVNDLLLELTQKYFLVVELARSSSRDTELVKVRWAESGSWQKKKILSRARFGLAPLVLEAEINSGFGDREHYRIEAPPGTTIRGHRTQEWDENIGEWRSTVLTSRQSLERVSVYSRVPGLRTYRVLVEVEPTRSPFLMPAVAGSAFMTILVGFYSAMELFFGQFSSRGSSSTVWRWSDYLTTVESAEAPANVDASVAVLALVPSLLVVYLVRQGEHQLVTKLLSIPRVILLIAALTTLTAAAVMAVQPLRSLVEYSLSTAFVVSLFACLHAAAILFRNTASHRSTVARISARGNLIESGPIQGG